MILMEDKNVIHFKQRLLLSCLPHKLEIVTVNGGESTSQYHTPLTVAKLAGKWKKIKSGYFIATPHIPVLHQALKCQNPLCSVMIMNFLFMHTLIMGARTV
jgi:hypothetical protein